ncbi:MAG: hypothetical protein R8M45_10955 [Ghiorsea sp.]
MKQKDVLKETKLTCEYGETSGTYETTIDIMGGEYSAIVEFDIDFEYSAEYDEGDTIKEILVSECILWTGTDLCAILAFNPDGMQDLQDNIYCAVVEKWGDDRNEQAAAHDDYKFEQYKDAKHGLA